MAKIGGSGFFSQSHGSPDPDPYKCHGSATLVDNIFGLRLRVGYRIKSVFNPLVMHDPTVFNRVLFTGGAEAGPHCRRSGSRPERGGQGTVQYAALFESGAPRPALPDLRWKATSMSIPSPCFLRHKY
jgi:hypothetical protein